MNAKIYNERKSCLVWLRIIIVIVVSILLLQSCRSRKVAVSTVVKDILKGRVSKIVFKTDESAIAYYTDVEGDIASVSFHKPKDMDFYQLLLQSGVSFAQMPELIIKRPNFFKRLLGSIFFQVFLAVLLSGIVLLFCIGLIIKKSREPLLRGESDLKTIENWSKSGWQWIAPKFSMNDVGGLNNAENKDVKKQIDEIVEMFKESHRFNELGARLPHGILLVGPSGVGKTMLAHAIASELHLKEVCCVTGPMLLGPLVGLPAMRLNDIFKDARRKTPCVVFLDELEAIGEHRHSSGTGGSGTEKNNLLTQLMIELETIGDSRILVIGATNRIDMLDPALFKIDRFEWQIYIDLPSPGSREDILRIHGEKKKLSNDVKDRLTLIARSPDFKNGTAGFSGADLGEMLNEAAINAGMKKQEEIEMHNILEGIDRVRKMMLRQSVNERGDGFGRSMVQFFVDGHSSTKMNDVGGLGSAKECIGMVIDFLKDYHSFFEAGCRIPRGVLLSGPPGIGKTLLARAVAGEAGVPFFIASGSQFVELYVGVAAARIRDMFRIARRQQNPCIIFIDEIDALGSNRTNGNEGGSKEYNQALNQILLEMDGFEKNEKIVVLAATNRVDILDKALLRPGRLEYVINLDLPTEEERREILKIYLKNEHTLTEEQIETLVTTMHRKSGADLEGLINTARIHAASDKRKRIKWVDIEYSLEKMRKDETPTFAHPV